MKHLAFNLTFDFLAMPAPIFRQRAGFRGRQPITHNARTKMVTTTQILSLTILLAASSGAACPSQQPVQLGSAALIHPVNGTIIRGFGPRGDSLTGVSGFHPGVDYHGEIGEPVRAASTGEVIYAGYVSGFGRRIVIRHEALKLDTAYAHLDHIGVKAGDCVKQGEVIGDIGDSGLTRPPPHLHFEVRRTGHSSDAYIDPAIVLPQGN
jgi:murein DD-endopeptidase MepM/ murein hydrolase activator NlpD